MQGSEVTLCSISVLLAIFACCIYMAAENPILGCIVFLSASFGFAILIVVLKLGSGRKDT